MYTLEDIIADIVSSKKIVLSKPTKQCKYRKAVAMQKGESMQVESFTDKQAFHMNVTRDELRTYLCTSLESNFMQLNAWDDAYEYSIRVTKKGEKLFNRHKSYAEVKVITGHNRDKNYLLPEGIVIPALVDIGVMTQQGTVVKSMYDKYKQINRFIELIDDTVRQKDFTQLKIIDFGCGKSYLTFVLYYYLVNVRNISAEIIGLDLKAEVIEHCNQVAQKYGYTGLRFEIGDIKDYQATTPVDMVISLHACDTATDLAIFNAIQWGAELIFCVPCCQHELNAQFKSDELSILSKYGIVQERTSALFTDAIRANILEYCGYNTQILEFIDIAHTPKNLLIRAVKGNVSKQRRDRAEAEVENIVKTFNLSPTLYSLIRNCVKQKILQH